MNPVVGRLPFIRRTGAVLSLLSALLFPARLEAQCSVSSGPVNFEPNPPGPGGPRPIPQLSPINMGNLALFQNGVGGPWRIFMQETFGYSTLDLTAPMSPSVLRWDYLPFDANPVPIGGDGQSYVASVAASSDGQRVALSLNGPGTPPYHTVVGTPDGSSGFKIRGDTSPASSGTIIQQAGGRYVLYLTGVGGVFAADITAIPGSLAAKNIPSEHAPWPGAQRAVLAGNYLVYPGSDYASVQIVDVSTPGPVGQITVGMPATTIPTAALGGGTIYGARAAVDPSNPRRLWILVEFAANAAAGENSPSYGLYSMTEDASGNFSAPGSSGPRFRVPSLPGETWSAAGSASALVTINGTVHVLAWAKRTVPSPQYVLYASTVLSWPAFSGNVITASGFGLSTDMGILPGSGSTVFAYIANTNNAWVLPMSCWAADAKATASLTATNAATGAPVNSGDAVVYGETLTFAPQVFPIPAAGQRTDLTGFRWIMDFDFHAGALPEDNGAGASPRLRNPDNDQFQNPSYPPAAATLVGPCDPRNLGVPATGAGCWASVTTNTAQGGPDFAGSETAGSLKTLVVGLEANNTNGSNGPNLFTVKWKRPNVGLASTQILAGEPLIATVDGHPQPDATHPWKWYFDPPGAGAVPVPGCTTPSCTPTGSAVTPGTHTYWVTVPYAQIGYSTPDYPGAAGTFSGTPALGTYTAASFVPVFAVNGTSTGPIGISSSGTITVDNSSKRAGGTTGSYQYCLVPAGSSCADGNYQAWSMPDPPSLTGSPASSATIPNPGGGSWLLKIRVRYTGGGAVDWPSANPAAGIAVTVTINLTVTATASPNPANSRDLVTFSCSATGGSGNYNYTWSGQFGTITTSQTFSSRFTNSGTSIASYTFTCDVVDSIGVAAGRADATISVLPVPPLVATATATPNPANNGSSVTFTCSATGGTRTGYAYAWAGTVGGTFATTQSFSQTFGNSTGSNQTYQYTCSVTDSGGTTANSTASLVVLPYPLTVTASATPNPASAGTPTQLTCSAAGVGPFSYTWSLSDGAVASGSPLVHAFANPGSYTATCAAYDAATGYGGQRSVTLSVTLPPGAGGPYSFFVLSPCRVLDTRSPAGPLGGPAIPPAGGADRAFAVTSACGIPSDAKAFSVNVTATNVNASGALLLYRGDGQPSSATTAGLVTGRTRANNAIVQLAFDGSGTIKVHNTSAGAFDLVLDVNGYFR
jgi:hypothetical protein